MKKWIMIAMIVGLTPFLASLAVAQMGPGYGGPGYGMGWGHGPGMMWWGQGQGWGPGAGGQYPCPGATGQVAGQITEESAKQLAQQYADAYLKGYTVDKVLPFMGRGGWTAYSVELKGPKDEVRILHVNPWGNVIPMNGPGGRAG
jgi:hypothetical protein